MENIKKLPFITYKESKDLDKVIIYMVDYSQNEDKTTEAKVFTKFGSCGKIESDLDLDYLIKNFFVSRIKDQIENEKIIKIDKKLLEIKEIDIIRTTIQKFTKQKIDADKSNPEKGVFVFLPLSKEKSNLTHKLRNYDIIFSDKLEDDEILFGRKNEVNEPGLILVSNDEGLKNKRYGIFEIGFFPMTPYNLIKII